MFPTIGFRIITELCPTEDLPRLESNELSNNAVRSGRLLPLASLCLNNYLEVSIVGVTRFEHGGEPCRFRFPAFPGTGLLEAAAGAELLQGLFPVELLFQSAKGFVHRFAFSEFYFSHVERRAND